MTGCVSGGVYALDSSITGEEIKDKFNQLQSISIPYEYENGVVLEKNAKIYQLKNGECAIVAILNNESNFGGYEDIIYFSNKSFKLGYTRSFFSIFLDHEATKKSDKVKYDEFITDNDTQKELQGDFMSYLKQMNKNTLNKCS